MSEYKNVRVADTPEATYEIYNQRKSDDTDRYMNYQYNYTYGGYNPPYNAPRPPVPPMIQPTPPRPPMPYPPMQPMPPYGCGRPPMQQPQYPAYPQYPSYPQYPTYPQYNPYPQNPPYYQVSQSGQYGVYDQFPYQQNQNR